jgi:thymidylate kinase
MTMHKQAGGASRATVLEIVGPPGSGKSTVLEGLLSHVDSVETNPILGRAPYRALLARHLASAVATLVRSRQIGRRTTRDQLLMMAYLRALPGAIDGRNSDGDCMLVFDQGPVYFLTRPSIRDSRLAGWWERSLEIWASRLDVVVWLDAPDAVLLGRINSRGKWHALKGHPERAARDVLRRSRHVYDQVLERLGANGAGPMILRYDTSRRPAVEIVDEITRSVGSGGRLRAGP